jgi:hypothetical protein
MSNDELTRDMWEIVKGTFAVVRKQNGMIEHLFNEQDRLMQLLRSEAGLEAATPEELRVREKLRAEIAALEKMFGDGSQEGGQHD